MSDDESVSSERSYIARKKIRTHEEVLRDLYSDVDISDGEYESDWSVGVGVDSDDEFGYTSGSDQGSPGNRDIMVEGTRMVLTRVDSCIDVEKLQEVNKIFTSPIHLKTSDTTEPLLSNPGDDGDNIEKMISKEMNIMEEETRKKKMEAREFVPEVNQQSGDGRQSKVQHLMIKPTGATCTGTTSELEIPTLDINLQQNTAAACSQSYHNTKSQNMVVPNHITKPQPFSGGKPTSDQPRQDTPASESSNVNMGNDIKTALAKPPVSVKTAQSECLSEPRTAATRRKLTQPDVAPSNSKKAKVRLFMYEPVDKAAANKKASMFRIDQQFEEQTACRTQMVVPLPRAIPPTVTSSPQGDTSKKGCFISIRRQLSRFGRFIRRKLKRSNTTVSPMYAGSED